jgi:hypothetical protein
MHAEHGSIMPPATHRVHRSLPAVIQRPPMATGRRSLIGNIFADEIVACMAEARRPTPAEVQRVAARIWSEVQAGEPWIAWRKLVPGCGRYRRMIAAARAALGDRNDGRRGDKPP